MPALERHERGGLVFWKSPALESIGAVHAFSSRHGGVSEGPFRSLNLGRSPMGDSDEWARVAENMRRFREAVLGGVQAVAPIQVHGSTVVDAPAEDCPADAIVGADPAVAVLVRTADCAPILLACPRSGLVAAVHAGWRGVVAGVIEAAIAHLRRRGAAVEELRGAIGPCIGPRAFEVGEEVAAAFGARDLHRFVHPCTGRKATIDLASAVLALLQRCGVDTRRIDGGGLCTVENEHDFFSYRRDGARSGRMAAAIRPLAVAEA